MTVIKKEKLKGNKLKTEKKPNSANVEEKQPPQKKVFHPLMQTRDEKHDFLTGLNFCISEFTTVL